ncbi:MAG: hypothetical protein JWO08_3981 [Verrucomicrobiaceae bacterium]|nr:hypothetical protein [Verrucomicrobiaceae bacterium]
MHTIVPHNVTEVPVAVFEEPCQYLLQIELPGMAREHIGLLVEDGMVRVLKGPFSTSPGLPEGSHGREVMSAWRLPADVEACSVVADFRDGVLKVRLPRASRARSAFAWPF